MLCPLEGCSQRFDDKTTLRTHIDDHFGRKGGECESGDRSQLGNGGGGSVSGATVDRGVVRVGGSGGAVPGTVGGVTVGGKQVQLQAGGGGVQATRIVTTTGECV